MQYQARLLLVCAVIMMAAGSAGAQENAALLGRGARIEVSSRNGVNELWSKPEEMLAEKPSGPILNDLQTAQITVYFPVPLQVVKIGLKQSDYRGGFAIGKDFTVSAPGAPSKDFTLANQADKVQLFDYAAKTDQIHIQMHSVYPPQTGTNPYGAFNQVQVLVADNLDTLFAVPATYQQGAQFIMRTANLDPQAAPPVVGTPRKATAHPFTIWDQQDIAEIKDQIAKYPRARAAYDKIITFCNEECAAPLAVPDQPDTDTNPAVADQHTKVSSGIANLGIGYALSGDERYAKEARRLLLELAKRYEGWPVHGSPNFTHDQSKWSWQRLGDAIWLIPSAWGYDLIYNSPSLSDDDRRAISDHFVMPCVRQIMSSPGFIEAPTNWSVIGAAAVMIGARVTGDREFYEKSYLGLSRKPDKKDGGLFYHLDNGIDDDGMWAEGSLGYQFMAMRGLLVMAEILWHDGIDAYSYRNDRMKYVFDSPIWYAYPGGTSSPAIHDGGGGSLFNRDSHLYQYALRRYGDKSYNAILSKVSPTLESVFNLFLPALDFKPVDQTDLPRVPSILFPGVGFAIARAGDGEDSKYLLLDYGPNRSHGHPDKLSFCLYALGHELFADAGSAWYSTDIYKRYYSQTLAHNTVGANGVSQIMTDARLEDYGSLGDMALMRAATDSAIPATVLDRTLFLSGNRLYDIYFVSSGIPATFELPYHSYGEMQQRVATAPWKEHPKDRPGYAYYTNPLAAQVNGDWQCTWKLPGGHMTMHYIGEPGSEVVFADTPKGGDELPTALVRRQTKETVFAGVCDLVPNGAADGIKSVTRTALPKNQGYALRTELAGGGYEQLMVSFANAGSQQFGAWRTDARVAFVRVLNNKLNAAYLAGGKSLTGPAGSITASTPALLSYITVKDGLAQLANQAPQPATVRLAGLGPVTLVTAVDRTGKRSGNNLLTPGGPGAQGGRDIQIEAAAGQTYELARGQQPTAAEYTEGLRRARLAAAAQHERQQRAAMEAQADDLIAKARAANVPQDYYVLIQAENMAGEGGGKVTVSDKKVGAYGSSLLQWNNKGHWLDYDVDVRQDGYYQVILKYCREGGATLRSLQIDGAFPSEAARKMELPGTGGWSNGADNWELYTLRWPELDKPALVYLKAGRHRLRLENPVGDEGVNLDYIVIAAPFMTVQRKAIEK